MGGDNPGCGAESSDLAELGDIIRAYSAAADELRYSHELLQAQVTRLTGELRKKNAELSETVLQVSSLKNYLDGVIRASADGIVAIGLDRRITAWNPAADVLFEFMDRPAGPVEGGFILDVMTGPCRDFAILLMRSLQANLAARRTDIRLTDQSGRLRQFSLSAGPVRDRDEVGGTVGAVLILSDLTEMRELETRANRQDRLSALGEMAAGVAHEIRNPLGGIELYASSLRRKFAAESSEYATCGKIIAAVASLNHIVTDMLTFARGRPPQFRPARPGQVLRSAVDLAARELEARGVSARLEIPVPDDPHLLDPDLMAQAALNVILNAAQAMERGGTVAVGTIAEPDGGFSFRFSDEGPGIPDRAKARIFEPFFTMRKDGTGLGLAIVHKIVHDHGGVIDVTDNRPRGTTVVFRLPADPGGGKSAEEASS
jgi:signal transduction histidine kinase